MSAPKIVPFSEIERITNDASFDTKLIDAIAKGFADFSSGKFNLCPIQTIGAPPMAPLVPNVENYAAQVCIKSGYVTGNPYFVIKVASGGHPLKNSGLMQVYSQKTGRLEALLLDEGILTELRTAAAGAVAVKYLGPSKVNRIGMVGTGIQARYQLRYLKQVSECRNVLLWGRTQEKAEALKDELLQEGWNVEVGQSANELLEFCNIIVTTTCAREAILDGAVTGPLLIICIGADTVGKQELSVELISKADCLVCDSLLQTQERGEFQHAIREGKVELEKCVQEIGNVVAAAGILSGNRHLCIFDSSGVAVQDCVVAQMVYESL
jgi:ornithine cyclodeaminase/alanine dehydrogenase-like protein (mu-crystallin family)